MRRQSFDLSMRPYYLLELILLPFLWISFDPTLSSLVLGLILFSVSLVVKIWLYSYEKTQDRDFQIVGPYRYMRLPGYFAALLAGLSLIILTRNMPLLIVFLGSFAVLVLSQKATIDQSREQEYGRHYLYYREKISLLIPSVFPAAASSSVKFTPGLVWKNRLQPEFDIFIGQALVFIFATVYLNAVTFEAFLFACGAVVSLFVLQRMWSRRAWLLHQKHT